MPADFLQGTPLANDNQTAAVKQETVKMFFRQLIWS